MDKSELKVETGRFGIEPYPYWVAVTHIETQKKAYACGMSQKKAYDECIRDLEGLLKKGPDRDEMIKQGYSCKVEEDREHG